ncbi:MAG TPA: PSD1 and planctomycete cytochrome C domain-containing protein, partial [Verrucomicrobiales bacterium]|nr:PSD1 and planctomycete cytochrome C domain-containing protein [Verrucomicrobiales bacterium]
MPALRVIASLIGWMTIAGGAVAASDDAAGIEFFERRVRPLLVDHCGSCHGAEKQKGKLRLDTPAGIRGGGESGPCLQPGLPEESRLITAVRYNDKDLQMPPKERLAERQVADLVQWIRMGAPMPEDAASAAVKKEFHITDADRAHWAFQPLKRTKGKEFNGSNPVDFFIKARLSEKGLTLNPPASKRELIRRAFFDLIGLPPSPEEVQAFERDAAPDSFEKVIDHLLSLPQYGERWGRHWLDIARFAQSNGYERDGEKLLAWRYRDYVIKAFNDDKPYDRFVLEQLAGDELPDATADSVTATAFQRLGVFDDEPDDKRMAEFDALDDIVSTSGGAFLGLTIGCARCHDHKFDPIPQRDYYSLLAFFRGVRPFENGQPSLKSPGFLPLASPRQPQQEAAGEWTLAVREAGPKPPPTRILIRGNAATEGTEVEPAFPGVLSAAKPGLEMPHAVSSGRRLALAKWIASPENPLTARVMVNRIWQHYMGAGIVRTTTDFGRAGAVPTHPQLLDALASAFVDSGWSMKKLHRLIMLSQCYRQSSRADRADALKADPGNELLWHHHLRRLEAEALRDSVLRVAGTLNPAMGGRGFFPHLGGEVLAGQSRPGLDWEVSSEREQSRRSVYAFVRRTMAVPLLETFDYSNTVSPLAERATTTVAPQALMLLNDGFMHQQAAAFADRLIREAGQGREAQIACAWQLAFNREPSPQEAKTAVEWIGRQTKAFEALSSRLTFRPDVAEALSADYYPKLQPSQFLTGPAEGWQYFRGVWAPAYEGIRVVERDRGPFALWGGAKFKDGAIEANVTLPGAVELAGILFRTSAAGDGVRGYEVV